MINSFLTNEKVKSVWGTSFFICTSVRYWSNESKYRTASTDLQNFSNYAKLNKKRKEKWKVPSTISKKGNKNEKQREAILCYTLLKSKYGKSKMKAPARTPRVFHSLVSALSKLFAAFIDRWFLIYSRPRHRTCFKRGPRTKQRRRSSSSRKCSRATMYGLPNFLDEISIGGQ